MNLRSAVRWLCRVMLSVLLLFVAAYIALYAGAKVYRYRAERLYERVKALRVGSTGLPEVQKLANDYRRDAVLERDRCSAEDCAFTIRLNNSKFPALYDAPVMWRLGIRPTFVATVVRVKEGKLTYASFGIYTRTQYGYWLAASFNAASELTMYDKCSDTRLGRYSNYAVNVGFITNGDGGGQYVETAFGRAAPARERISATEVRLNCIAAIPGCKRVTDLMPRVYDSISPDPDHDKPFNEECQEYAKKLKIGNGPWKVNSAFYPDPISVNSWIVMRSDQ